MAKKISDKQQENIELKAAKNALKDDIGSRERQVSNAKASQNLDSGFKQSLRRIGLTKGHLGYGVALILVLVVGVVGSYIVSSSQAGQPASTSQNVKKSPSMYLLPADSNVSKGQTFTLQLKANSVSTSVNAVQATLSYPAQMLDLVSINHKDSAYKIDAVEQSGNGKIVIARGQIGGLTGDNLVASITFKAKNAAGTANIQFVNETSLLSSSTNTSIVSLENAKQATVKIKN